MPYVLKPNELFARDPNNNRGYLPQNVIATQTADEQVALVEAAGASTIAAVNDAISDSQRSIDTIISVAGQGTDTGLTQSGAAADAKVVGDAIDSLYDSLDFVQKTHVTNTTKTNNGMTFSGANDELTIYGSNTATGLRTVEYLNGASATCASNSETSKILPAGLYRVFLRVSKTLNKTLNVYVTETTYGSSVGGSLHDGDFVLAENDIAVGLGVPKDTDFGDENSPTVIEYGVEQVAAKDTLSREVISEFLQNFDRVSESKITDFNNDNRYGCTLTKLSDTDLSIYGTGNGSTRVITFLNGQSDVLVTTSAFKPTLDKGTYKIDVSISGNSNYSRMPIVYTYGSTTNEVFLNSGIYTFSSPVVIGIHIYSNTTFGTSSNPTTIHFEATKLRGKHGISSTNDNADRAPEIMYQLNHYGYCELDSGDYYISQIKMPEKSRLFGKGNATRLYFIETEQGSAISMNTHCRVDNLCLYGSTDETYDQTQNSGKFPGSENKDFTGETNLWADGDQSITDTGYIHMVMTNALPAGEYYIEVDSVASETPTETSRINFSTSQTTSIGTPSIISYVDLPKGSNVGSYFTLTDTVYSIRLVSGVTSTESEGYTGTWSGIHIYRIASRNGIEWIGNMSDSYDPYMQAGSITDCRIERFSCAGILGMDTGTPITKGLHIANCQIQYCNVGIYFRRYCEFSQVIGCMVWMCYYGVLNRGGNNIFDACAFSGNYINIQQDADEGGNTGHGMITNCKIHHSGYNSNQSYGLIIRNTGRIVVTGCEIADKILLKQTNGNIIAGNAMFTIDLVVDGGSCNILSDMVFRAPSTLKRINGNTATVIRDCYLRDGTPLTWSDDVKFAFIGESSSTYDGYSESPSETIVINGVTYPYRIPYYPKGNVDYVDEMWWYRLCKKASVSDYIVSAVSSARLLGDRLFESTEGCPAPWHSNRIARITEYQPDYIFINVGLGDVFDSERDSVLPNTCVVSELESLSPSIGRGLALLICKLRAELPNAKIIGMIPKNTASTSNFDSKCAIADLLEKVYKRYGADQIIDLRMCGITTENALSYSVDSSGNNPNSAGMQLIADYIWSQLQFNPKF